MKNFFLIIVSFFAGLWHKVFSKKAGLKEIKAKEFRDAVESPGESVGQIRYRPHKVMPKHNNRKVTRGRFVQYILINGGPQTKPIYHGAKN